jgi:hypothetical protein
VLAHIGFFFANFAEMKEQLREAESRATPPEPESAHEERVDAIKEEARLAWQNIDRLQLQIQYPPMAQLALFLFKHVPTSVP